MKGKGRGKMWGWVMRAVIEVQELNPSEVCSRLPERLTSRHIQAYQQFKRVI